MTRDETKKILLAVCSIYTNFKPMDMSITVDTWHILLEDYDYSDIHKAMIAFMRVDTSGFAPTPAQLINTLHEVCETSKYLNPVEAWDLVRKALCNSTYNSINEFNKLPYECQKAVGAPSQLRSWATDENFNEEVAMSQFIRVYKGIVEHSKQVERVPQKFRSEIAISQNEDFDYTLIGDMIYTEDRTEVPCPDDFMDKVKRAMS